MRRSGLILTLILLFTVAAYSQDLRKSLEDLKRKYEAAENMHIIVSVNAYESKSSQQPFYRERTEIKKHGSSYKYKMSQIDMIMNDRCIVVVDHSTHEIIINDRDVREEVKFYKKASINMDSLLGLYANGKYEGVEGGSDKYSLIPEKGDIQKMELFIDNTSGNIARINYVYKGGQMVKISFDEFDLTSSISSNEFDEKRLVRKTGKTWQPTASLKNYRIVMPDKPEKL